MGIVVNYIVFKVGLKYIFFIKRGNKGTKRNLIFLILYLTNWLTKVDDLLNE